MRFRLMAAALAVSSTVTTLAAPAFAADVATPSYQIKLRVSPAAVDANGNPTAAAQQALGIGAQGTPDDELYADTSDRFYGNHNWTMRVQLPQGSTTCKLTYKYRVPLADNTLSKATVDDGLNDARDQGFNSSDTNYKAQVNASAHTSTLDFSNKKTMSCPNGLPQGQAAVDALAAQEPGKITKQTGTTISQQPVGASAPVTERNWAANVGGVNSELQVTKIGGQYYVEVSDEDGSRTDAIDKRDRMTNALKSADLYMHSDAFKTNYVLAGSL